MGRENSHRGAVLTTDLTKTTYEDAFNTVQLAVDAEKNKDPVLAMDLYTEAGQALVEVGKRENDSIIRQGVQKKAFELLTRAEQLDEWNKKMEQESKAHGVPMHELDHVPLPQQKKAISEIATVEAAWNGGTAPFHEGREFTHLKYTAVTTTDPINFDKDGYSLRVHSSQRGIKTLITVTMYNEDGDELRRTLEGIVKNLELMCEKEDPNSWQHVAVAVVSDGRTKASQSCWDYLSSVGAFDEETMDVTSLGVDVQMHLFESTIQYRKDKNFDAFYPPLQLIYALKEHNGGKLNSHLWYFNAFAEQLMPEYTLLVDVGTVAGPDSVYRLIKTMDRNPNIGGVAGEIAVDKPNFCNPIVASQHFEYKISNIMDKSLESVFGFISVLPGAFSGYRYQAIRVENGVGPLADYFKSLTTSTKDLGPFKGNMYLAEDRILGFEVLARPGKKWLMAYVKGAIARTDVPMTLVDLIKQRRRWLNGSFFAGVYAIINFWRVWRDSAHSFPRKLLLTVQFFYLTLNNILSWFLVGNLFLGFYYVLSVFLNSRSEAALQAIMMFYVLLVGGVIIFALGNKPDKRSGIFYMVCMLYFAIVMYLVVGVSVAGLALDVTVTDGSGLPTCSVTNFELSLGIIGATGVIFFCAMIHGEFGVFLSTPMYYALLPTYINILGIFAYSNLHDLSWGTKGLESGGGHGPSKAKAGGAGGVKDVAKMRKAMEAAKAKAAAEALDTENSFRTFRSTLLMIWLFTNGVLCYFATRFVAASCYLKVLSYIVVAFNLVRAIGSTVFLFMSPIQTGCCPGKKGSNVYRSNTPEEWREYHRNRGKPGATPTSDELERQAGGETDVPFSHL